MGRERCASASPLSHRVQSTVGGGMPLRASRSHVRNTVVMIVLAILAAATWIATWQRPDAGPPVDRERRRGSRSGYYLRGARLLGTDEQGRIIVSRLRRTPRRASRRRATAARRASTSTIEPADETAWALSAASASAPKDGSQLDLARQRRGSQHTGRRLGAGDDRHGAAAVFARHFERRVGRDAWRSVSAIGNSAASGYART